MKDEALRIAFTRTLLELAQEDPAIIGLATDSRGSVTLTEFAEKLPEQFVECGIAEQDAIGISAGMANGGFRPFVCGPACFFSIRSAEQIKVDVAYSHMNVKIIGVSGGVSYGALGLTHHSTQDIALMRATTGLEIFIPADGPQMVALTKYLAQSNNPAYVRMGRGAVPIVYENDVPFIPGKANCLHEGKQAAIIACGEMVYRALQAALILEAEGIDIAVYDMHTLRPLDEAAILAAAETNLVVTAEEHSIHGGLGGAVAEVLSQKRPTKMRILGLPDEKLYTGSSSEVLGFYGLTSEGISQVVREGR
jgi:transketolase